VLFVVMFNINVRVRSVVMFVVTVNINVRVRSVVCVICSYG
jgi:hypothetical protein